MYLQVLQRDELQRDELHSHHCRSMVECVVDASSNTAVMAGMPQHPTVLTSLPDFLMHLRCFVQYRIITGQTATGGAFSSDFLSALSADFTNNGTSNSTNSTAADTSTNLSLNRTYAGASVPVDVYSVSSSSNVNASNLCAALTSTSSGEYLHTWC